MRTNLKKIGWCVVAGLVASLIYFFSIQIRHVNFLKKSLSINTINQKGIFVGENPSVLTPAPNQVDQEIDYVWAQIHLGNTEKIAGNFQKAAEFYKKAVYGLSSNQEHIIPGRSMAGKYLIEVYEKLEQYDDALEVVNWLEKIYISESGKKYCAETRTRLLAAKEQSSAK